MRAILSRILFLAILATTTLSLRGQSVYFTSSGFYAHESQGSFSICIQGTGDTFSEPTTIFVYSTNSSHGYRSTAVFFTDYSTNATFVKNGTDGAGNAVLTVDNNTQCVSVPLLVNSNLVDGETIVFGFWSGVGVSSPSVCTVTLLTDPLVTLACTQPTAKQLGPISGQFVLTRSGEQYDTISVNLATSGTAVLGTDYTLSGTGVSGSTVSMPAGTTSVTINVNPVVNSTPGPNKTVILGLSSGTYKTNTVNSGTVTIINKNPMVTVAATDTNASRSGDSGMFTITRTADLGFPLTVYYNLNGTATNGVDYAFISNSVTIPSGVNLANVTVAPIYNNAITTNRTVILTITNNSAYTVGTSNSATVNIAPFDDNSRAIPTNSLGLLVASATNGQFIRVATPYNPSYESLVVPVDSEKGVAMDNVGGNGAILFPTNPWPTTLYHFNGSNAYSSNSISLRIPFQNPIVAFGSRVGGSPLYYGQSYTFGVYAGDAKPTYTNADTYTNALRIQVIDRNTFTNVATVYFPIPDITQTASWASFLTNGYSSTLTAYGLTTTLYFDNPYSTWGTFGTQGHSDVTYHLSHTAANVGTNYIYEIELSGGTDYGWMVVDSSTNRAWERLYTVEFESRPAWRSLVVQLPQFQGQPMPPFYDGKSLAELLTNAPLVTNVVGITNPALYTNIDQSPELRRHPILDQLVSNMGGDPIALANYVINNIQLCDAIDYNDNGSVSDTSINLGGVNRGAASTYLEGEGSPTEQCALLVYLLRQAGVPATYLFPPHDGMLMLDSRLSKMLRTQIHGAINDSTGTTYTTNILIPVNYPWVAAYIGTNWVHIFPWIKDTSIKQGFKVWDYMPTNYNDAMKWSLAYMYGDTNLLNLSGEDDTPNTLFPLFVKQQLAIKAPTVSFDSLGVTAYDRQNYYARWSDFPMPNYLTNTQTVVESLGSSSITNVLPALTNIFNTVSVSVSSVANPATQVSTGDMRMAELLNRRFIVRHVEIATNSHRLIVSMESFRSNITSTVDFSTLSLTNPSNTNILCNLMSSNTLGSTDDALNVTIIHKRHRDLGTAFTIPNYWTPYLGFSSTLITTNIRSMSKGDTAAICLNAGRVSPKMLQQEAQELWQMEQQVAANPSITNSLSPDLYQGGVAYLMGMGYYEKLDEYKTMLDHLLGTRTTLYASGLARLVAKRDPTTGLLPNGTITLNQPMVDMYFLEVAALGNETFRLDSGDDGYGSIEQWFQLFITGGSAQEHGIINTYFGQQNAISTVKLLRLAQQTPSGIIRLDKNNYVTQGNTAYPSGSSTLLKNYSSSIWQTISNSFNSGTSTNYAQAFITPGLITNATVSYVGLGAMVFADPSYVAAISPNFYGGYGETVPDQTVNVANTPNYALTVDESGTYNFDATAPTTTAPIITPAVTPPAQFADQYSQVQSGTSKVTDVQSAELSQYQQQDNISSGTSAQDTLKDIANSGAMTPVVEKSFFGKIADPVDAVTGEFYVDNTDLTLNGPMPLQVRRNYSSQNLFDNGLGYGWKLNYLPYVSVSSDTNLIYCAEPEGSVIAYRRQTNNVNLWIPTLKDNPRLQNLSGSMGNLFNAILVRSTNSTSTNFTLTKPNGEVRIYAVNAFPISTLTRSRPYLVKWQDNSGNSFQFSYGTNSANNDYGQVNRIQSSNGNFLGFDYDIYGQIIDAYTGDGRMVQYDYDQYGDLVTVTLPDNTQVSYQYQHLDYTSGTVVGVYSSHLLIEEDKPEGRVLQNSYDSQRRVINQYATVGYDLRPVRNASFVYSNNFTLATMATNFISGKTFVTDWLTNVYQYGYTNGFITNTIDPLSQTSVEFLYPDVTNSPGYPRALWQTKDKRGLWTTYQYDSFGNVTNTTATGDITGAGNTNEQAVTTVTYNTNNLPLVVTDPLGNSITYIYDTNFPFLPQQTIKAAGGTNISTNFMVYGGSTNVVTNGVTVLTNIALGLLQRQIVAYNSPDAATNDWVYDGHGFLTQQTAYSGTGDPNVVQNYFYNLQGQMIERDDSANRTNRFAYDDMGRPISTEVIDENGNLISWNETYYNENGEVQWVDGPRYNPEDYIWRDYDGAGRVTQEVHWRSEANASGSGVEAVAGDNEYATTFREYDPFGNLIKVIDPRGNYTRNTYDAIGQLLVSRQFDGSAATNATPLAVTQYSYEPGGLVALTTNALGGVTSKIYTTKGQIKFQSNPDGSTNGWRYDLSGRVVKAYLNNGNYWLTTYDDVHKRVSKIFNNATAALATNVVQFDNRGNQIQTIDPLGNVFTNFFDGLNRIKIAAGPATITVANVGLLPGTNFVTNILQQVTTHIYDGSGKVLIVSNALGETTVTTNDALGRPTTVAIYNSGSVTPVRITSTYYSPDHNSMTVTNGTGTGAIVTTSYTDADGHPVLSVSYPTNGIIEYVLRQYDLAGNCIAQQQCSSNSSGVTVWATNGWTYDGLNRVYTETSKDGATTTYSYDALGDVTNRAMPGNLSWTATYLNDGRIATEQEQGGSLTARSKTYQYYAAGNPFAGSLQTVTDGRGTTTSNSYDAFMRLATVTTTGSSAQQQTIATYQYDLRNLLTNLSQSFASTNTGPSTVLTRTFDGYGRIVSESTSVAGVTLSSFGQGWDVGGRRSQLGGTPFNYQADGGMIASDGSVFGYGNNGLLTGRTNASRNYVVNGRDGCGRILSTTTSVGISTALSESLAWRNDGRLTNYVAVRGDFTDVRNYSYSPLAQRLTQESFNVAAMQSQTNNFTIDNGSTGGLGILTGQTVSGANSSTWSIPTSGGLDALSRVADAQNTLINRPAFGLAQGAGTVSATLDSHPVNVAFDGPYGGGQWRANLELSPGSHTLAVTAVDPSGIYSGSTNSVFTVTNTALDTITNSYDANGNVTTRYWINSLGQTNRVQTLTWDAFDRLISVTDRDTVSNGLNWTAIYDGLGRRLRTINTLVVSNVAVTTLNSSNTVSTVDSWYDPQVKFLEAGVVVNGIYTSKTFGPDANGVYGGLQGVGGLESIYVTGHSKAVGSVSDIFGNIIGTITNSTVLWNAARFSGYGPVPGYQTPSLSQNFSLAQSVGWRGKRIDETGLFYDGKRYYEPVAGRFLSADPMGHGGSSDLYSFAGGDPVNYFDAKGQVASSVWREAGTDFDALTSSTFWGGMGSDASALPGRFVNGVVQLGATGSDIIGSTGAGIFDYFAGTDYQGYYQGYSKLYQSIYQNPNSGPTGGDILVGTLKAEANVGTFGIYGIAEGAYNGVQTGNWNQAQDASFGLLVTAGTAYAVPKVAAAYQSWQASPAPTFDVGDVMPNGQVAGVGPGAMYIGENVNAGPAGVVRNANGGVDFSDSPDLYPAGEGQQNTVKIKYTGSRRQDFGAANKAAGTGTTQKPPEGYTWHHLDDYNPADNTGTMQLIKTTTHEATYPHVGGVSQYEAATGATYR